ncbi:MAG: divalent-cation tolerance protein CutA [Rhodospirillales bacterium]
MSACVLYMTASSMEEASRIGRALVEARLVACVNLIDGMRSIYWWQGAVEEGAEVVVIAKTRRDLVDRATALVKSLHGYAVPCVVALPIEAGNPDYLAWIAAETAAP